MKSNYFMIDLVFDLDDLIDLVTISFNLNYP